MDLPGETVDEGPSDSSHMVDERPPAVIEQPWGIVMEAGEEHSPSIHRVLYYNHIHSREGSVPPHQDIAIKFL
ncbi:hypothetical protein SAY87_022261 [Trapa incisa]|uniref:Uncharacterized protein n=1 Tax=Trapa incisa TaxID=236973 RepID=A0AAN7JSY7_9MYRT|nr:hypothetical protein SAY87_022261 [Trapa incisa]